MDKCSGHECRKLRATTCISCGWNKEETKTIINSNKTKMGQQLTFTPTQLDLAKEWAENFLQNPDLDKTVAGNMAAGVRVRKELFKIMKIAKSARKEVTRRKHIKKSKKEQTKHV